MLHGDQLYPLVQISVLDERAEECAVVVPGQLRTTQRACLMLLTQQMQLAGRVLLAEDRLLLELISQRRRAVIAVVCTQKNPNQAHG